MTKSETKKLLEMKSELRQELRDITEGLTTAEEVEAVIWPTKPGT